MEETWGFVFISRLFDGLRSFCVDFMQDWKANDMRLAVFKILLSWLLLSLIAIHIAWKVYGTTVNDMYYRQGTGGQNGGTPDTAPHLSSWDSVGEESFKTHRE